MSDNRVGTDGQPSVRPDGGSHRRLNTSLPRRRGTWAFLAAGAALVLLAVGIVIGHAVGPKPPTAASASADTQAGNQVEGLRLAATPGPGTPSRQRPAAEIQPLAATQDEPAAATAIHIPRLNISQSMISLHVQPDRSLSVPKKFSDIGWWSEGPRPAAPGAVIIAGHVSSKSGPGIFIRLSDMLKGDLVQVDRTDGTTAVFQVRGKASYPRNSYPDKIVYRTSGKASIHLITCDGAFNPAIGHHEDNLVVFADLVSTGPTKEKIA